MPQGVIAIEPFSAAIGKLALGEMAKPTLQKLRRQISTRGSQYADLSAKIGSDTELDQALGVLAGDAESLPQALAQRLAGLITDRPSSFASADARLFVGDPRIAALVKSSTRKTFADEDIDDDHAAARAIHTELFGGDGIFGETLFDEAVRYCVFALLAHLTPADRLVIEFIQEQGETILSEIAALQQTLEPMATQLGEIHKNSPLNAVSVEPAVIDDAIEREVKRLRQLRFALGDALPAKAEALGERLDAGLQLASPAAKALAYREISIVLTRAKRPDEAEPWVVKAEALGADTACERARLALARDEPEDAMKLLRDRDDAVSRSLMIDAVNARDGEAEALAFFEGNYSGHELTGHALQAVSYRMANAGRLADAETLLSAASPEQIDENPILLYARAHLRIALALPDDVAKRFLNREGMIPQPGDLREDAQGARALSAAQDDLTALHILLPDLESADLTMLVDMNLLFLGMCVGDEAAREAGRKTLVERLAVPAEAVRLAPLASLYDIDLDWTAIRSALDRAEKLGGFDDAELNAAFTLAARSGSPGDLAALIQKYRDRLSDYQGVSTVLSMEIEALARSGNIEGATSLLDRERDNIDPTDLSFLEATMIEIQGGDSIAARIAQFEKTNSTHDLQVLAGTLAAASDDRTGDYLVILWRRRRQLDDARHACDALIRAGKEEDAEAFLDELGSIARTDTFLQTHLAWARQRQGRLTEAKEELDALIAGGADDRNIRQLRIILAVETGRWSDLVAFVQNELAMQTQRSAKQLMEAARIAQAVDSGEAMSLVRAAIAKNPTDPELNLEGYTVAISAGLERSSEVAGWFAAAKAASGPEGPLVEKQLDDYVTMHREARERSDNLNRKVTSAELPIFLAMSQLGTTQSAMILRQLPENSELTDSRRKILFPLFAGNREPLGDFDPQIIGFDPIALLLLDYLNLLPRALSAFKEIVLPAGTLHSFFEDRVKSGPPQPSRIAQAREIKDRIRSGFLTIEELEADEALAEEVGEEFATLYAAAEARDGYVIAGPPFYRPGDFNAHVDPEPYHDRLTSPAGLVDALHDMGVLSRVRASAALEQVAGAGRWDTEPQAEPGKPLFLTNVAVQYLSDARLLPILKAHAGALIIQRDVEDFADQEIAAATDSATISAGIERVRAAVAEGISSGHVRIGPTRNRKDEPRRDEDRINGPVMSILRDSGGVEAFVCDDRGMNKYLKFDDRNGAQVPFLTTPDLLIILKRRDLLTDDELIAARETLRSAGAGLMPITGDELVEAVATSNWDIGPNAELRMIRDSIHLPIARGLVQLPQERVWFKLVSLHIGMTIRRVWQDFDDMTRAARAATYLLDMLPDPEAASGGDESSDRAYWIQDVSRHTLWAFASIFDLGSDKAEAYRRWFSAYVAPAAERRDPGVIEALAKTLTTFLSTPEEPEENTSDAG